MADELGTAAMYALRAIVDGLRDSGVLTQHAIETIETYTGIGINFAGVLESAGSAADPEEARILRHGMWWARECIAPTGGFAPGPITNHERFLHDWPSLEERQALDEGR